MNQVNLNQDLLALKEAGGTRIPRGRGKGNGKGKGRGSKDAWKGMWREDIQRVYISVSSEKRAALFLWLALFFGVFVAEFLSSCGVLFAPFAVLGKCVLSPLSPFFVCLSIFSGCVVCLAKPFFGRTRSGIRPA